MPKPVLKGAKRIRKLSVQDNLPFLIQKSNINKDKPNFEDPFTIGLTNP